ncbi:V-set and transmembrane domain-containing protein 4 isoform X3 [Xenopus tropicalis]|uniref:V-set and transmembrane domain-containing protein 4 isoform X3 n=1 Tax=Xenopus tropicalis TaxID=8364 RepID=A0A8J1JUR8_XENTR|nr:V-set and transmembrane domain-containing protein 4 isoform X3 [Xenopus tropicalis]
MSLPASLSPSVSWKSFGNAGSSTMTLFILTSALLSQSLIAGISFCLNVTVHPHPWVQHATGENTSLWCSVTQRRRQDSLLTVRWVFSSESGPEQIIGRITKFGTAHTSGNWSHRGNLSSDGPGKGYRLMLRDLRLSDQGQYICRVQEVARHRNRWTAVSNGTADTKLKVTSHSVSEEKKLFAWNLFQVRWKCPHESPNDESPSVTDLLSPPPSMRKKKKNRSKDVDTPPAIPVKGPSVRLTRNTEKPLLLPRLVEEGLAYAELELMKSPPPVKEPTASTVYAQILFEESFLQQKMHSEKQSATTGNPMQRL